MPADRKKWLTLAAFAVVYLVWGSTYLAIRIGLQSLPPLLMAGSRFLVAGSILAAWSLLPLAFVIVAALPARADELSREQQIADIEKQIAELNRRLDELRRQPQNPNKFIEGTLNPEWAKARADGKHYRDFNREQQAQIAEDYYVVKTTGHPGRYRGSQADLQPFIDEMRAGDL